MYKFIYFTIDIFWPFVVAIFFLLVYIYERKNTNDEIIQFFLFLVFLFFGVGIIKPFCGFTFSEGFYSRESATWQVRVLQEEKEELQFLMQKKQIEKEIAHLKKVLDPIKQSPSLKLITFISKYWMWSTILFLFIIQMLIGIYALEKYKILFLKIASITAFLFIIGIHNIFFGIRITKDRYVSYYSKGTLIGEIEELNEEKEELEILLLKKPLEEQVNALKLKVASQD